MISRPRLYLYRLIFGLLLLGFWELSSGRLIDPFWVSSPSLVFVYLYGVFADGSIYGHLAITLYETFTGVRWTVLRPFGTVRRGRAPPNPHRLKGRGNSA